MAASAPVKPRVDQHQQRVGPSGNPEQCHSRRAADLVAGLPGFAVADDNQAFAVDDGLHVKSGRRKFERERPGEFQQCEVSCRGLSVAHELRMHDGPLGTVMNDAVRPHQTERSRSGSNCFPRLPVAAGTTGDGADIENSAAIAANLVIRDEAP
jgi:hypothetical protein